MSIFDSSRLSVERHLQQHTFVRQFQKFQKSYVKFEFLSQKTLYLDQKVQKSLETGFSEHSEISEIVLFRTFQKLRKNDVKLELRKSRKTRSDSKTDSKVRLKVRNAGPYYVLTYSFVKLSK